MPAALATNWPDDANALPTGGTCTMTHASVYLVGGQGNWNGTNCWTRPMGRRSRCRAARGIYSRRPA